MYCFKEKKRDGKKALASKGLKGWKLEFKDYYDVLFGEKEKQHSYKTIRQVKHKLGEFSITMRGLCSFDDKRFIYDNINSLAHGHKLIESDYGIRQSHSSDAANHETFVI